MIKHHIMSLLFLAAAAFSGIECLGTNPVRHGLWLWSLSPALSCTLEAAACAKKQ